MIKRLNFLLDENASVIDDKLDLGVGNYKDALDFAITKSLTPSPMLKPGPYLGVVLRKDEPDTGKWGPFDFMTPWMNDVFGADSETENPMPSPLMKYKVRIPEFDAAIPEPPNVCETPTDDNDAQKYIEMHTTFVAKDDSEEAEPGQLVWVDFGDYKTKDSPIFLGPYFNSKGETQTISSREMSEGAKAAFEKCAGYLSGSPDGFAAAAADLWNTYTNGKMNFFSGDDNKKESEEKGSETPKNTFPRECSILTSRNLDNTPDTKEEEDNLKFMEEEVIPRLVPIMKESNPLFVISSVYRSNELNDEVGGSPGSYHAKGLAIDFGGLSNLKSDERNKEFAKAMDNLKKNKAKLPWIRTVIAEQWRNHIHIDVYQPPQKSGSTAYRTWKLEKLDMEQY
tara:strand:+ start:283 stop:1470 length:1188 start_codon:yes stop_codon:yes gene_type:complete